MEDRPAGLVNRKTISAAFLKNEKARVLTSILAFFAGEYHRHSL
jgi:hypothetical protein